MRLGKPRTRIILALDTADREQSLKVMDQCRDVVDAVKVNYPLVLQEGLAFIRELKDRYGLPIIADFKVADVPVTNNRIARLAKSAGVDGLMVHGFVGPDALMEIMDIGGEDMDIFVVTELTHPGGLEFTRPHAKQFAEMAKFLGCAGIQAPGTRPEQIRLLRETVGPEMTIITCGIGAQGGVLREAIQAGATFGIIGRAIYEADDPRQAAEELGNWQEESEAAISEVQVMRFCAETERYTVRIVPADSMKAVLVPFVAYCREHKIGLSLHTDGGVLIKKGKHMMHIYEDGTCLLSNMPSLEESETIAGDWLEEIRRDFAAERN